MRNLPLTTFCLGLLSCTAGPAQRTAGPTDAAQRESRPSQRQADAQAEREADVQKDPGSAESARHGTTRKGEGKVGRSEAAPLFPGASFPPPDPGPLHEQTAQEGDGRWEAWMPTAASADSADGAPDPLIVRTVLHPHPRSTWQTVTLAAFDQEKVEIGHRPGTADVEDTQRKDLLPHAGLVPADDQDRLLAVFNGGFQPRHGWWGMHTLGTQVVPPKPEGCTVAIMKDGAARVAPWPRIEEQRDDVQSFRQTPPCLVVEGKLHPKLQRGIDKPWGGNHADHKTRRRSAVGVSKDGRTLFYALGSETDPQKLAEALVAAGAQFAAQLDINWNWTRLFTFAPADSAIEVSASLVEQMAKDRGEYLSRPSGRDFFYVQRRRPDAGPVSPRSTRPRDSP